MIDQLLAVAAICPTDPEKDGFFKREGWSSIEREKITGWLKKPMRLMTSDTYVIQSGEVKLEDKKLMYINGPIKVRLTDIGGDYLVCMDTNT